jgi:intracellular multiplication protein IcmJ
MTFRDLFVGIIRDPARYRANAKSGNADREYRAKRPDVMRKGNYKCQFCGWRSTKNNECHHLSGDHADNSDQNLAIADTLCHGYHHLGQRASQERFAPDSLGASSILATIPELTAADMNLLLRAIGVAMTKESEAPIAEELLKRLSERAYPVKKAFGTFAPGDFAAAMTIDKMTDDQFRKAQSLLQSLRLIFRKDVLKEEARKFKEDFPGLPFESWNAVVGSPSSQD